MGTPNRRETREANAADLERRIRSAVADVIDGDVSLSRAAKNRNVPQERLRTALAAAGWKSRVQQPTTPRRRTFGNGRRNGKVAPP